ncbi:hypothetical protein WJX72_000576 [[Myrmecia] bisecta]|uniref:RPAP1 N-terminal domain-containing protein n=1 Tax=[Myrmecia] bisecta TaxID=41462 RepID=A0AAW1QNZ4_9CHLO
MSLDQFYKEFLGGQKQPAAQVFRVGHAKQTAPEPEYSQGAPEADAQDVLGSAAPLDVSAPASGGFLQAMADILGEVQEREVREGSSAAPIMPTKDPFPVAAHRKASKFALGRSRQKPNADAAEDEAEARLAAMTPKEIMQEQRDLQARLSPGALAFFQRRAARKQAGASKGLPPTPQTSQKLSLAASATAPKDAEAPMAGRLRFGLDGEVLGVDPEGQGAGAADVVSRDLLRQDEGTAAEGYTIREACTLEADIAVVLRRALDDRDLAVIAAAAEAILALVGGPVNRELPFGIADACPVTGLPCVPVRFLERPHPIGAWVANPTEPYVPQTRQELEEDAEEPPDAAKVARFDPLIGLVQMQVLPRICYVLDVLPRIRYVLDVARSPGAVQPLLDTLIHVAQAGHDTSQAVYQCPGLWRSVLGVLTSLPPAGRDASAVEGAYYGMRPKALTLVRVMCQASADLARELLQSGAGAAACRFLSASAMSDGSLGVAARDVPAMHLQVEAMRIWQTSAAYGVPLIHLDDVYPTICRYFEAQAGAAGAAPDAQQTAGPASPAPSAGAAGTGATPSTSKHPGG